MKKPFFHSATTQNVAAAGTVTGAALTVGDMLAAAFPDNPVLSNPAVTVFVTFLLNSVLLPWMSRQLARLRGK